MNGHFSHEMLHSALAGKLPTADETALAVHLETCDACSAELERLVGEDEVCRDAALFLINDERDAALPIGEGWSEIDFVVEHLEAADEPDVLGRLGGYDVLEVIGRGGMGVVLKGFDRQLKRCVAIKVLAPHLVRSSLARQRFAREAQAAAAVVHPNVLAIHQVQPQGRLPFLVMPLVAGQSLAERIAEKGTLELKEILRIGMQAAAGLAAAHEQGLVHRDVKPANILLEKGVERAVLTDFGLARAADDVTLTRQGIIAGTPEYMSPEQARGEPLDGRSDLFSLGSVIYQMASGVSPFRTDSTVATLRRLVDESPRSLASQNPELPPWLAAIVERLIEKDPDRRFNSAKEVSQLLEGCLAHVQQPATVPLPAGLPKPTRRIRLRLSNRVLKGVVAMTSVLAIGLACLLLLPGDIPDISGRWSGDDWGTVELTPNGTGQYTGTFSDTSRKGPGELELKWSRVEWRFNGTWREGENRFGQISIRLAGQEIRGAFTTDLKSKLNPGTPALADLAWQRGERPRAEIAKAEGEAPRWRPGPTPGVFTLQPASTPTWVPGPEIFAEHLAKVVAWSPDGKTLAIGGRRSVRLYDAQTGQPAALLAPKELVTGTEVSALAFSPDSRLVAVGHSVGLVSLFEAQSGKLVAEVHNHTTVVALAFSPDGALLATGSPRLIVYSAEGEAQPTSEDGTLKLWDVATGELKRDLNGKDGGSVVAVAFSPDGQLLASAGALAADGDMPGVRLWNPQTGQTVRDFPIGNGGPQALSLSFSPEGSRLAIGLVEMSPAGARGAIWVLDPATGVVDHKLNGMSASQIAFSPDGAFIAAFGGPRRFSLWDSSTGEFKQQIDAPAQSKGEGWNRFAFSPDGNRVAIGGLIDGKQGVRVWSWETAAERPGEPIAERPGEPIAETAGQNEGNPPPSFQFSKVTATPTLTIESQQPPKLIAYAPDGKTLATAGNGLTVELFDAESGKPLAKIASIDGHELTFLKSQDSPLRERLGFNGADIAQWHASALAFSPDSKLLAVGNSLGQAKLFDARDGSFKFAIGDPAAGSQTSVPDELRDLMRFALIPRSKSIGRPAWTFDSVQSIAFSPDGKLLVTSGDGEQEIRLWDAKTGEPRPAIIGENNYTCGPVAFSPDGKRLAGVATWWAGKETVSGVKLRDPHTGVVLKAVRLPILDGRALSISFAADGRNLAVSLTTYDQDRDLTVGGIQVVQAPSGYIAPLSMMTVPRFTPVAYSPGRNDLIAAFSDTSQLTFWKLGGLAPNGAGMIEPPNSSGNEQWDCFAFAGEGNRIAIGGTIDGKPGARIWDLAEKAVPVEATSHGASRNEGKPQPKADTPKVSATPTLTIESQGPPKLIVYSPDGKTLATAGNGLTVELFDAQSGKSLAKVESIDEDEQEFFKSDRSYVHKLRTKDWHVSALAFSPNSRTLAVANSVGPVKCFDARDGSCTGTVGANLPRDRSILDNVASIAFSPDGSLLVTSGGGAECVRLWNAKTYEPRPAIEGEHNTSGGPVAFHPDGNLLAGAATWTVGKEPVSGFKLRDAKTGEALNSVRLGNSDDRTVSFSFSPDGIYLVHAFAYYDQSVDRTVGSAQRLYVAPVPFQTYELSTGPTIGRTPGQTTTSHESNPIYANPPPAFPSTLVFPHPTPVVYSPDGKYLAFFNGANKLTLFSTTDWSEAGTIDAADPAAKQKWDCFAFAGEGNRIAIGGTIDGKPGVRIWDLAEKAVPVEATLQGASRNEGKPQPKANAPKVTATPALTIESAQPPKLVAYSPDGKTLATAGNGLTVELFDAQSGQPLAKVESISKEELAVFMGDDSPRPTGRLDDAAAARCHVSALAFSPDSKSLAVGNSIGQVKMFDAHDGSFKLAIGDSMRPTSVADALCARMRIAHNQIASIAFSPDGRLLATSGELYGVSGTDQRIRLWNADSGEPRPEIEGEHNIVPGPVAFSPDGKLLAGAAIWQGRGEQIGGVKFRNPTTGEVIKAVRLLNPGDRTVSISFSPDGKFLAHAFTTYDNDRDRTLGAIQRVSVFSGDVGAPAMFTVPRPTPVSYSPEGNYLAGFNGANKVTLWAADHSWREAGTIEPPDPAANENWNCFAFAPVGNRIAIGGTIDGKPGVRIWDLAEEAVPAEAPVQAPGQNEQKPEPAASTPKAAATMDLELFTPQPVKVVAYSPDGKTLAIGGGSGMATLHDAKSGQQTFALKLLAGEVVPGLPPNLASQQPRPDVWVASMAFSPDSRLLAVATGDGPVELFDVATGKLAKRIQADPGARQIAFSPDGSLLAVGAGLMAEHDRGVESGSLKLWDIGSGKLQRELKLDEERIAMVTSLAFSPDGLSLASVVKYNRHRNGEPVLEGVEDYTSHRVDLWDTRTGKSTKQRIPIESLSPIECVAFSPDGSLAISGVAAGSGKIDVFYPGWLFNFNVDRVLPDHVAFSPDGESIAALADPRRFILRDTTRSGFVTPREIVAPKRSKGEGWNCFALSPDGDRVAIGGLIDGKPGVRIWNLSEKGVSSEAPRSTQVNFANRLCADCHGRPMGVTEKGSGSVAVDKALEFLHRAASGESAGPSDGAAVPPPGAAAAVVVDLSNGVQLFIGLRRESEGKIGLYLNGLPLDEAGLKKLAEILSKLGKAPTIGMESGGIPERDVADEMSRVCELLRAKNTAADGAAAPAPSAEPLPRTETDSGL